MASSSLIRICFVSPSIYPLFAPLVRAPHADADIALFELARKLGGESLADISVVTGDYEQDEVEYMGGVLVYRGQPVEQQPWYKRWWKKAEGLEALLQSIDPQVVVMAGASPWVGAIGEWCRRNRRAFVFRLSHPRDCDGTYVHSQGEEGQRYRGALQSAKTIVSPTHELARMIKRTEKLNAVVIPPYVPQAMMQESREMEAVWLGEIVDWAQPEYFLRLAATLPQVTFTMYGRPRKPEFLERLVEKTRDLPNLGFHNSVPHAELSSFVANAKLLVNTSRTDGFPFPMAMAIRLGVPLASLNLDPDGLIESRQVGICAHGSEVRLAQEVLALMTYDKQWKYFRDNVEKLATEVLDPATVYQSWWKLLLRSASGVKGK